MKWEKQDDSMKYSRGRLCGQPERLNEAVVHPKAGNSKKAYRQGMQASLRPRSAVPRWDLVPTAEGRIAAGMNENDFHRQKNLSPNVCALFVKLEDRCRGIARPVVVWSEPAMRGFIYWRVV